MSGNIVAGAHPMMQYVRSAVGPPRGPVGSPGTLSGFGSSPIILADFTEECGVKITSRDLNKIHQCISTVRT
jgi:hypothetical protein